MVVKKRLGKLALALIVLNEIRGAVVVWLVIRAGLRAKGII